MHRSGGEAWAWEAAVNAAVDRAAEDPERHPPCRDPAVQGRGLREVRSGTGPTG